MSTKITIEMQQENNESMTLLDRLTIIYFLEHPEEFDDVLNTETEQFWKAMTMMFMWLNDLHIDLDKNRNSYGKDTKFQMKFLVDELYKYIERLKSGYE